MKKAKKERRKRQKERYSKGEIPRHAALGRGEPPALHTRKKKVDGLKTHELGRTTPVQEREKKGKKNGGGNKS